MKFYKKMFLETQIYKYFNYDFHNCSKRKNEARRVLHDLASDIEIYKIFDLIDEKIKTFPIYDHFLQSNFKTNIDDIILEEDKWIKSNINDLLQIKYTRNSRYLFSNGEITLNLPAHYKFDELIAARLGFRSNKKIFVPTWSNTIRIYGNSAEIKFQPTGAQTEKLLDLKIQSFFYNDRYFDNIFDTIVDKIPKFPLPWNSV